MSVQLVLKNSSVQDKEATAAQLAVGELALNYHSSGPFLQCEDSAGNIWRLGGVVIASTAPSSPSKGAWWLDSDDDHLYFYDGTSWIEIQTGEIVPGDITEGTARQLLQTNAAGTATEWTSNIDVPGTLDVTGVATFDNNVVITGNLTVNGTTTTIDTTTLVVEDKNIELGVVGTPTDTTADGGGITVKGATDKTLTWVNSTGMWTSNQPFDVAGEVQCDSLDVDGAADISGNVTLHGNLDLQDNDKILLGTGDDLEIYHDGSNSFIRDATVGDLKIRGDNYLRIENANGSETKATFATNGPVDLYYDDVKKFETTSTGINVTGTVACDGLTCNDTAIIQAPGTPILILKDTSGTGNSSVGYILGRDQNDVNKFQIGDPATGSEILLIKNYATSSIQFETNSKSVYLNSGGHLIPGNNNDADLGSSSVQWRNGWFDGTVNCDQLDVDGDADITGNVVLHGDLDLQDSDRILIGAGDDLQLYHDGTNSSINNYNGDLYIQNYADDKSIVLQTDNGSGGATAFLRCDGNNGEVNLYYYGSQKLRTTSSGINVTGQMVSDGIVSDGGVTLTNTDAPQLVLKDSDSSGSAARIKLEAHGSDNVVDWFIGHTSTSNNSITFRNEDNQPIYFGTNGSNRVELSADGHWVPQANNTYDLGTSSNKWRSAYFDDSVYTDLLQVDEQAGFLGKVYGSYRTATASSFNLATGNFWTFGAIAVPNPSNQTTGISGLLVVTAAPTSFASNWKFPGGSYTAPTTFPAVAPFFIQSAGSSILVGSWTEGIA
jgi:hypothetical protein